MLTVLLACVCLLNQAANADAVDEQENLETCLKDANEKLKKDLVVPIEVKELRMMAANEGLDEVYMLDLVGSNKDNLKSVKNVFGELAKDAKYVKSCIAFDDAAMSLMRSFKCEQKMREVSSVSAMSNIHILGEDNEIYRVNRYRTTCLMLQLSA